MERRKSCRERKSIIGNENTIHIHNGILSLKKNDATKTPDKLVEF